MTSQTVGNLAARSTQKAAHALLLSQFGKRLLQAHEAGIDCTLMFSGFLARSQMSSWASPMAPDLGTSKAECFRFGP